MTDFIREVTRRLVAMEAQKVDDMMLGRQSPEQWRGDCKMPVFTAHDDGRITVSHYPDRLVLTRELIEARGPSLRLSGRLLLFNCSGAKATYRLVRRWQFLRIYGAERTE